MEHFMPLGSVVPVLTIQKGNGLPVKGPHPGSPAPNHPLFARIPDESRIGEPTLPGHSACSAVGEVTVDVRDGFIVGIFNYCDRWCDAVRVYVAMPSLCRQG